MLGRAELSNRHPGVCWRLLRRRYPSGAPGWRPVEDGIELYFSGGSGLNPRPSALPQANWSGVATATCVTGRAVVDVSA